MMRILFLKNIFDFFGHDNMLIREDEQSVGAY